MKKWIHVSLYAIFTVFYLSQMFQFIFSKGFDITGPYPFLLSMIIFNLLFILMSKEKLNDLALGAAILYFVWYTVIFFTVRPEGPTTLPAYQFYYFFVPVTFLPAELNILTNYFETVLAASIYVLPFVFIVNFDLIKKMFIKKS